jgi:hypothetical protein
MNKVNWAQVAVFSGVTLLVLLIGLSFLSFGWGGGGMMGPGMMGPGTMGPGTMGPGMMGGRGGSVGGSWGVLGGLLSLVGLLIPLGLLALLALGGVWLFRQVNLSQGPAARPAQLASDETCPSCGRAVQADWQLCPYCGQGLV